MSSVASARAKVERRTAHAGPPLTRSNTSRSPSRASTTSERPRPTTPRCDLRSAISARVVCSIDSASFSCFSTASTRWRASTGSHASLALREARHHLILPRHRRAASIAPLGGRPARNAPRVLQASRTAHRHPAAPTPPPDRGRSVPRRHISSAMNSGAARGGVAPIASAHRVATRVTSWFENAQLGQPSSGPSRHCR